MSQRAKFLEELVAKIVSLPSERVQRVAIDGVDGAGKTRLADELAPLVAARGRPIIRASVDGFHRPRAERYRLGKDSPEGFFQDSYNYATLRRVLLDPLSPGGDLTYAPAIFEVESDSELPLQALQAASDAILLFDGIFLHRRELRAYWDFSLFLRVPFEISLERDRVRSGRLENRESALSSRYIEGQKIYFARENPEAAATWIVDYSDLENPQVLRRR